MCPPVRTCFFRCLFRCLFPFISISSNHWFVVSVCKGKGISSNLYRFGIWWQLVAASGREWLRSPHVSNGLNALPLHPSGRAKPKARTEGIGLPMPCRVGDDRSIPNPFTTDFCVLKDTARYVSSYSKPCGLLPQALPLKGEGASSPKSGSLSPPAVCV